MTVPRRLTMATAAFTGLAAGLILAQDSAPPRDPLRKLRGEWRAQVEKETAALRGQYANGLLALEKELVAGGDYPGASKVRRERLRIRDESAARPRPALASDPGDATGDAPFELKPAAASTTGGVVLDAALDALTGWTAAGAAARWLLPRGLNAGGYEVELTWSGTGGDFILKGDQYTLRRTVEPTAGADDWQTAVVGTLRLAAGSQSLELSAAEVKVPPLFQLKSIRLLPVSLTK